MSYLAQTLNAIRENSPLVHNITNYVVMNNTANGLLSLGASPVMAHAIEEVEDIVTISSALVINMGTLSEKWVDAMLLAVKKARSTNTPIVFDPVGVGASKYRTAMAQQIIEAGTPDIIRGNASEIMALAQLTNTSKGVDSTMDSQDAIEGGKTLSKTLNNTIIISGETDYIITGNQITSISNGSPLMSKITGMGCTATAIVGACLAVEPNIHQAGVAAMAIMGVVGDITTKLSNGPGTFQTYFLDGLHQLTPEKLVELAKIND